MEREPGAVEPPRPAAAVVALKPVAHAKSRLGTLPDPLRRRLAWTMAVDTLTALGAAVELVLVVGDQPALASRLARAGVVAEVVPEAGAHGLNGALDRGAELARARGYRSVLACVGDVPALRPTSVRTVLDAVVEGRAFLADASGVGTTMLLAHGVALQPHFQGRSAAAHHRSGASALTDDRLGTAVPDARCDVDTEVDLGSAASLGLGRATAALLAPGTHRLATSTVITTTGWTDDEGRPLAVTASGHRLVLADAVVDGLLTPLRVGQRLHAVHTDGVVGSAWL